MLKCEKNTVCIVFFMYFVDKIWYLGILKHCCPIKKLKGLVFLSDNSEKKIVNYAYNTSEIETLNLINAYRLSIGLSSLEKNNYISFKSEEHDNYMIANDLVNHDDSVNRSENIMKVLGAKSVGENIAYNYTTPEAVFNAWLSSPVHKENIEGDFTCFGISIRENPITGDKYYTNIFAKM